MDKRPEYVIWPVYNEDLQCPDCKESNVLTDLHGMFGGGGPGRYTMCENCGRVITKDLESEEEESDAASDTDKPE